LDKVTLGQSRYRYVPYSHQRITGLHACMVGRAARGDDHDEPLVARLVNADANAGGTVRSRTVENCVRAADRAYHCAQASVQEITLRHAPCGTLNGLIEPFAKRCHSLGAIGADRNLLEAARADAAPLQSPSQPANTGADKCRKVQVRIPVSRAENIEDLIDEPKVRGYACPRKGENDHECDEKREASPYHRGSPPSS